MYCWLVGVTEQGNHYITKLTTTGQYIKKFECNGFAPGELCKPTTPTIISLIT